MSKMLKSYHFSVGNSSTGPVGFCARINATSKAKALNRIREQLPSEISRFVSGLQQGEYVAVYFNADGIQIEDIDEENNENEEPEFSGKPSLDKLNEHIETTENDPDNFKQET